MNAGEIAAPETVLQVTSIDQTSRAELARALDVLHRGPGLLVRAAGLMGGVMSRTMTAGARTIGFAPGLEDQMRAISAAALRRAFDISVLGLASAPGVAVDAIGRRRNASRAVVTISGAVGGFLGMGGFVPDATVTTLAIMREIARIAQQEGESLDDLETRRACLLVFALTPVKGIDGQSEWSYLSARMMMRGTPLVMLFSEVSARYGLSLSQKFALQAVPVAGAIGGAALNGAFLSHYRDVATAHFTIRRLERRYGSSFVEREMAEIHPVADR